MKANPLNEHKDIAQRAIFRILWLFLPAVIMLVAIPDLRDDFHLILMAFTVVLILSLFVDIYRLKNPDANKAAIYCFSVVILFPIFLFLFWVLPRWD